MRRRRADPVRLIAPLMLLLAAFMAAACARHVDRVAPPPAPPPPPAPALAPPEPPPPPPPLDPQVQPVRGRAETVDAVGYSASQGTVIRIERVAVIPTRAVPGATLALRARVVALVPGDDARVPVREAWTVLFAGTALMSLPPRELSLPQGTNEIERTFRLPSDAADSEYTVEVVVQSTGSAEPREARATGAFAVVAPGPLQVDQDSRAGREANRPGRQLIIKAESVDVRAAPGPGSRVRARISRGSPVQVLEERQSGRDLWYRVRLANGDEGWIPAAVAGPGGR